MLTRYLWDYATNTCLAEMDEQGETLVDYTVDPQTGELISENHGGQEVYHRYDGDGNTRQTADSAGNVLGEATYSAFGETVAESGDMQTTYRFRGQRGFSTDSLTGDLSQGNQIYSPSLGRGLSLAGVSGTVDVNRYEARVVSLSNYRSKLPTVFGNGFPGRHCAIAWLAGPCTRRVRRGRCVVHRI